MAAPATAALRSLAKGCNWPIADTPDRALSGRPPQVVSRFRNSDHRRSSRLHPDGHGAEPLNPGYAASCSVPHMQLRTVGWAGMDPRSWLDTLAWRCVDAEAAGRVVDSAWHRCRRERRPVQDGDSRSRPDRILTVSPDATFVVPATVASSSATLPGSSFLGPKPRAAPTQPLHGDPESKTGQKSKPLTR